MIRRPRRFTLFPYTPLFRSVEDWAFGLVDRDREPKPAFAGVASRYKGPLPPPLPRYPRISVEAAARAPCRDRKSTRLNSSHGYISYAVFCLKKKKTIHEANP